MRQSKLNRGVNAIRIRPETLSGVPDAAIRCWSSTTGNYL